RRTGLAPRADARHALGLREQPPPSGDPRRRARAAGGGVGGGRRDRGRGIGRCRRSVDAGRAMASRGSDRAGVVRRLRASGGMTSHDFPSPAWVAAYEDAINKSQEYRAASTEWTHGCVALVMPAQPAIGVADDVGIWLDLDRGVCRGAKLVTRAEAQQAAFVLTAEYRYWKQIIK